MQSNDNNKNRGTHGDSSFMLDRLLLSSENPPGLTVGSVNVRSISYIRTVGMVQFLGVLS